MGTEIYVEPGDTVWSETLHPSHAVRLLDETPERNRPRHADGVPADSVLFGVHLSDSIAYCQPIAYEDAVRRVQCYRDLDDNGTFDGTYLSRQRGLDSHYLVAYVHALTAVSQVRYEPVEQPGTLSTTGEVVFDMHRGQPVFRRRIGEETLDSRSSCSPLPDTPATCDLFGVRMEMEPSGDGRYRIRLIRAIPQRGLVVQIENTGL
ncbi:MAG: hypothetical protein U9P68_13925 [Pseudomonadota bacterium]|nr:hypothetical protein [Pseudomonadota bacterium]